MPGAAYFVSALLLLCSITGILHVTFILISVDMFCLMFASRSKVKPRQWENVMGKENGIIHRSLSIKSEIVIEDTFLLTGALWLKAYLFSGRRLSDIVECANMEEEGGKATEDMQKANISFVSTI